MQMANNMKNDAFAFYYYIFRYFQLVPTHSLVVSGASLNKMKKQTILVLILSCFDFLYGLFNRCLSDFIAINILFYVLFFSCIFAIAAALTIEISIVQVCNNQIILMHLNILIVNYLRFIFWNQDMLCAWCWYTCACVCVCMCWMEKIGKTYENPCNPSEINRKVNVNGH